MSLRITLHGPPFLSRRRSRHSVSGCEKGKKTIGEKKRRGTETRVCKEMFKRRDQRYGGCLLNSYSDAANDLWLDREKKTRWKKEKKGRRRKKEGRGKEMLQNPLEVFQRSNEELGPQNLMDGRRGYVIGCMSFVAANRTREGAVVATARRSRSRIVIRCEFIRRIRRYAPRIGPRYLQGSLVSWFTEC